MTGFDLPASLSSLLRRFKKNTYASMNRIARGWIPEGNLMPESRPTVKKACLLSFSSRSRRRLNRIRQVCGHYH